MRPNFYRSDAGVAACGAGWAAESAGRGHAEASESVTLRSTGGRTCPALRMSSRRRSGDDVGVRCVGSVQDFGAGKLRNWKSEKLTARAHPQIARISDFQDFRFSSHAVPEDLARWAGLRERQLHARTRTFMFGLYKQSLKDRKRPIPVF